MKIRDVLRKYTEDNKGYVSSKLSTADSTVVHKSGDETIDGTKTFGSTVYFKGTNYYIDGEYYNGKAEYAQRSAGNGAFYISGYQIYVG